MDKMSKATELLKSHWGYDDFKKGQKAVLESIFNGNNIFAVFPTGFGKTIIFQIPALMADGGTIVFSPLISLMKDQMDDCLKRNISASYINSQISEEESYKRLNDFIDGKTKIIYIAPERMKNDVFCEHIKKANVSIIAVDEAHCVSRYGHDFRPAYSNIKKIFSLIQNTPQMIAVTATATCDIEDDIIKSLGINEYSRIIADPIRPNLVYNVIKTHNPYETLETLLKEIFGMENSKHIIYTPTRNMAEQLGDVYLNKYFNEDHVGYYHAGMNKSEREAIQNEFKDGKLKIICATCAFGMGIDIPNIRTIIHFGIPSSLEDLVQECGRAGRDGKESNLYLLDFEDGRKTQQFFFETKNPPYIYYMQVWKYLHEKLQENEILKLSGDSIASEIFYKNGGQMIGSYKINGQMVSTILSYMEKKGMVKRESNTGKIKIGLNMKELKSENNLKGNMKKIAIELQKMYHDNTYFQDKGILQTTELAEKLSLKEQSVKSAIKSLSKKGLLTSETMFRGKTTQVLKYGQDIEKFVSKQEITNKRERDKQRLINIIAYTQVQDRKEFIRNYFMKSKKPVEV